ncbi:MAG: exodeoxyribonuclease V subunit alpha [Chlamydiae bacterium]|nr:exodeoxyribonuclease V subunit alpha [Chlamydiota bacterium]
MEEVVSYWPSLSAQVNETGIAAIDIYLAKFLLKKEIEPSEEVAAFLCMLCAAARLGHLCLIENTSSFSPSAEDLFENKESCKIVGELAWRGKDLIPSYLLGGHDNNSRHRPLQKRNNGFYIQKNAFFEDRFLDHLQRIISQDHTYCVNPKDPPSMMNEEQKRAVHLALTSQLCCIVGGPGTGKTFTASEIVHQFLFHFQKNHSRLPKILLTAPTGKAAMHLEKNVRKNSSLSLEMISGTLHMLLSIKSSEDMMKSAAPLFADLIIVDEASMIDSRLFSYFFSALQPGTKVILMGDKDQLPPVESGSFFADLVEVSLASGIVPCCELKTCLRSDRQHILAFAESVNARNLNAAQDILHQSEGSLQRLCIFSGNRSYRDALEDLWKICKDKFLSVEPSENEPSQLLEFFDQFRILSCVRKGPLGVDAINRYLYKRCLAQQPVREVCALPILITRNQYDLNLFNGDVGVLVKKKSGEKYLSMEDEAYFYDKAHGSYRKIPALMLPPFEYAFCLSVHKSQGSEYKEVLILATDSSETFGKEVLYTAITRAKETVYIDITEDILSSLVTRSSRKISGIYARLTS